MKEAWAVRPEKIPSDQIKGIYEADIVVVGAGHAGTCAARAAAEAGARVIVLEQQEEDRQWVLGIGRDRTYQQPVARAHGVPPVDVDTFVNDWQLRTGNRSLFPLIKTYAMHCGEAFDWLIAPLIPGGKGWDPSDADAAKPSYAGDVEWFSCVAGNA